MKQKTLLYLILTILSLNIIIIGSYFIYNWILSMNIPQSNWFIIFSIGGFIFIVIDTIEIILLRHGQKGGQIGKTILVAITKGAKDLGKDKDAQAAFVYLGENLGMAIARGMEMAYADEGGTSAGNPARAKSYPPIPVPEKYKYMEKTINHPTIKKKFWDMFDKDKAKVAKPGEKVEFE